MWHEFLLLPIWAKLFWIVSCLFLAYVVVRVLAFGVFRSFFQAKILVYKQLLKGDRKCQKENHEKM